MNDRFLINRQDGKIMGVAAGLADWAGIDVLLVRLGLVGLLLLTGPLVILFYILTGWLAAER
ncbi:MAG TPA: PspC domain-containing protein [Sphingomicrobium sp.]|jgi:phage shock protein C|nr:PspC domain-containing protein [Sphingomicrobium sp.]